MQYKDYYATLGLSRTASQDEIKRAYRKRARKYHPDVNQEQAAATKFKEASEAYEVLKDPEKRAAYDQLGVNWNPEEPFRRPPDWDQGFAFSGGGFTDAHPSEFSDFFETLFGQARQTGGAGPEFRTAGRDEHARISVDIADTYAGATRTLTLRMQEIDPAGRVRFKDRSIAVHIPKGVIEGQLIRLKGQGQPSFNAGRAGDLFLEIAFAPHPVFCVDGRDIALDLPVTPWEAALGGKVAMPTPAGKVDITIPRNARGGQKLRLKGRGIPGVVPGDLYAVLKIVNPEVKTEKAREFYQKMASEMSFDPRARMKV